ncbi:F-box protein PP2-B15-like [Vigna unguiculata]|uniref:F-box protein PP2-B15-like n=1 Tax=Vigna unguiculata TaxID=3917 RepID=UPI001016B364|nr:F-box protein PP2-B15-like [Vigna unguiculata]
MVPPPIVLKTVGTVLGELLAAVMKIREETAMLKRTLDTLQSTLMSLTPVIRDIERLDGDLGRSKEELEPLKKIIEDGTKLVYDCSKVQWFNCVSRCRYKAKLKILNDWFRTDFNTIMTAHYVRDQKEILRLKKLNQGTNLLHPQPGAYVVTARDLYIAWGDTALYWTWTPSTHPSFPEVAELRAVCWLEITGWIKTSSLPSNQYEAYFVFSKGGKGTFGFHKQPVEVSLKVVGEEGDGQKQAGYLELETRPNRTYNAGLTRPLISKPEPMFEVKRRPDGLLEVKLGGFFTGGREDKEVQMGVHEIKDLWWKGGIIVQGIEIRPK